MKREKGSRRSSLPTALRVLRQNVRFITSPRSVNVSRLLTPVYASIITLLDQVAMNIMFHIFDNIRKWFSKCETVDLPSFKQLLLHFTLVTAVNFSRCVIITPANEVWGKVMFLHPCSILFTEGGDLHLCVILFTGGSASSYEGGSASRGVG